MQRSNGPVACSLSRRPNRAQLDLGGFSMAKKKLKKGKKLSGAKSLFVKKVM